MSCISPVTAAVYENGKRTKQRMFVPCGRCYNCLMVKRVKWFVRIYLQSLVSKYTNFLTLTYTDRELPEYGSLCKRDIDLFLKKVRHILTDKENFRFFIAGEYGGSTYRPHYHAIIFTSNMQDVKTFIGAWRNTHGEVDVSNSCHETMMYCTHHIIGRSQHPDIDVREKPFLKSSRRPALGVDYMLKHKGRFTDNHDFSFKIDGSKYCIPSFLVYKIMDKKEFSYDPVENDSWFQGIKDCDSAIQLAAYKLSQEKILHSLKKRKKL